MLISLCALLIGMSKAGLSGGGLLVVPVMAAVFGGKPSTGIVLPMLIVADIFAVAFYHRYARLKYLLKLIPSALVGIVIGLFVGDSLNSKQFNIMLAAVVIAGVVLVMVFDFTRIRQNIPENRFFTMFTGLLGGFTTMVGNAAGPVMKMYLLAVRLPKNDFIGTAAWFFMIVNWTKVPLQAFVWKTITPTSLLLNALMVVPIITGALLGIRVVKLIPERAYRIFVLITTSLSAFVLFFK